MSTTYIKSIEAKGVYGRYDFKHEFNHGINIIFGKNGAGKTTLLHVLANSLNGDFERLNYLEFKSIKIIFSDQKVLQVIKRKNVNKSSTIEATLNKVMVYPTFSGMDCNSEYYKKIWSELTGFDDSGYSSTSLRSIYFDLYEEAEGSDLVKMWIREYFGSEEYEQAEDLEYILSRHTLAWLKNEETNPFWLPRTAYFPAFRTMIDAWNASDDSEKQDNIDITELARNHFGQFIPSINFPSLQYIEKYLDKEISEAKERVLNTDRHLFSKAFLSVFASLSDRSQVQEKSEDLLEEIKQVFSHLEHSPLGITSSKVTGFQWDSASNAVYGQLKEELAKLYNNEGILDPNAGRILKIYLDVLNNSLQAQENAFSGIERYKASVNQFLESPKSFEYLVEPASYHEPRLGIRIGNEPELEKLETLSSGERQIFTILFAAIHMETYKVVLVDEPEISLHVDWQRRLLAKIAEHIGDRQIIVCTHSPVIAADFQDQMEEITFRHRDFLLRKTGKSQKNLGELS